MKPKLDAAWFAEADAYVGDKLVQKGRPVMKPFVKKNIIQWHRDQRDRANAIAKADPEKAADAKRSADRHARIIKEMTS